jgi:FtsZ-binding cell division protein ZapB
MTDIIIMCDKENRMSKEHEDTIARLMLEINRLHGDIATLAQEHTSMRARNERLEAERELAFEDIQKIYKEIFKWDIKNPKDNWVLLVREIEKRIKDAQKI